MKHLSHSILAISGLLMVGCSTSEYTVEGVEDIDVSTLTEVESWQFDDLYESVNIVPLETTEEALFADILQTVTTDTDIFVRAALSSETNDASVWQFNSDGKFIRQIGTFGEGPGEYNSINNIVLRNDTLFAFDGHKTNVLLYNARSGEFLYSSPVDKFEPLLSANTILPIPGSSNFLFSSDVFFGDETYGIAECNPLTGYFKEIVPQRFKVSSWRSYQFGRPTLAEYGKDKALAMLPLNDTIYSVSYANGMVEPFAILKLEASLPEFAPNEEYDTALKQAEEKKYVNALRGIFASGNYLIVNRSIGSIVWNLKEQKGKYTLNGWIESTEVAFPFFPVYIVESRSNNAFVCAYDAEYFLQYSKTKINKSIVKSATDLDSITDESNAVLVTYKLK